MTPTCRFGDEGEKMLCSEVLSCVTTVGGHTAENLSLQLTEVIQEHEDKEAVPTVPMSVQYDSVYRVSNCLCCLDFESGSQDPVHTSKQSTLDCPRNECHRLVSVGGTSQPPSR